MFCPNCGKQIDENSEFCENCGAKLKEDAVSEASSQIDTDLKVENDTPKKSSKMERKVFAIFLFLGIFIIIAIIVIGIVISEVLDNHYQKEKDQKINEIQNSYFEFLSEMTIGDLLNNTHHPFNDSAEMWNCDVENTIEFWGYSDEADICMIIDFTGTTEDDIAKISCRKIDLDKTSPAEEVDIETFESYILDLYSIYQGTDKSLASMGSETSTLTESTAVQTTTKQTTTEATKTTAAKTQEKMEESAGYLYYLAMLNEMDAETKREYDVDNFLYYQYYLYDINHDGFYELFVHAGESEAEAGILVYSFDESGELLELGEIGGGHSWLTEKDGKLYRNFGHQGYQIVKEIQMVGWHDKWSVVEETVLEQDNLSDYESYGTAIKRYDISDTSAVEALCPKDVLEDKPYVDAHVETRSFSGRDGVESHLYLDGDFAYVSVESSYERYGDSDSDFAEYSYDETRDGIVVYQGSDMVVPTLYITPYSELGVAGDVVTCDVSTEISGTIQTGGMSYPVDNMKGQINCHGGTVAGFTTEYVVNGGEVGKVRSSLGDTWHVTAKNACDNYGVTWYELWDSDDSDYYGWVDENFIDFY